MAWVGSAAVAGCGGSDSTIDETDTGTGDDTGSVDTGGGADSTTDSGTGDTGASDTGTDDTGGGDTGGDGGGDGGGGDSGGDATEGGTDGGADGGTDGTTIDSTSTDSTSTDSASDAADTAETPAAPAITAVSISAPTGYTDKQVRQGLGAITLAVTGTNLTGATAATMTGTVTCTVAASTATTATLNCTVPHGETIGFKDLTLTTPGGNASSTGALEVTRITVLGTTGNDTTGVGTTSRPFRSVSAGLAVSGASATAGDTVFIRSMGDGITSATARYSTTNIPTQTWATAAGAANVPAGITIEGETGTGVVRPVLEGGATNVALKLAGGTVIKNLVLRNFGNSVLASTGTTTITDTEMFSTPPGGGGGGGTFATDRHIIVSGGTLNVQSSAGTLPGSTRPLCVLDGSTLELLRITGSPTVNVQGCLLRGSFEYAVDTTDGAFTLNLTNDLVANNGNFGVGDAADGGVNLRGGTTTVQTSTIQDNFGFGIRAYGTANVNVRSSLLSGNGQGVGAITTGGYAATTGNNGVDFLGNGTLNIGRVTGSTVDTSITKNGFSGLAVRVGPGGASTTPTVNLAGLTMTGNGTTAPEIFIDTAASVTARNLSVTSGTGGALQVGSVGDPAATVAITARLPSKLDFGTSTSMGSNTLLTTAGNYAIVDRRGALTTATGTVLSVCGTSMNGTTLSVGTTVAGAVTGSGFSYNIRHTFERLGCP